MPRNDASPVGVGVGVGVEVGVEPDQLIEFQEETSKKKRVFYPFGLIKDPENGPIALFGFPQHAHAGAFIPGPVPA